MYILKICRCCDSIIGELETDDPNLVMDTSIEVRGNVAYSICPHCMQELHPSEIVYYQ